MMKFFSDIFEGFLDVFAVLGLIAGAIGGGIAGSAIDHAFLGVLIGILVTFVFEVIFFGALAQIIAIKNFLGRVSDSQEDDTRSFDIKELLKEQNNILQKIAYKE